MLGEQYASHMTVTDVGVVPLLSHLSGRSIAFCHMSRRQRPGHSHRTCSIASSLFVSGRWFRGQGVSQRSKSLAAHLRQLASREHVIGVGVHTWDVRAGRGEFTRCRQDNRCRQCPIRIRLGDARFVVTSIVEPNGLRVAPCVGLREKISSRFKLPVNRLRLKRRRRQVLRRMW